LSLQGSRQAQTLRPTPQPLHRGSGVSLFALGVVAQECGTLWHRAALSSLSTECGSRGARVEGESRDEVKAPERRDPFPGAKLVRDTDAEEGYREGYTEEGRMDPRDPWIQGIQGIEGIHSPERSLSGPLREQRAEGIQGKSLDRRDRREWIHSARTSFDPGDTSSESNKGATRSAGPSSRDELNPKP
jgi:hypothetical protein